MMRCGRAVLAAAFVAGLAEIADPAFAEEAKIESAAIGELFLPYDPAEWDVEGEADTFLIRSVESRSDRYEIHVGIRDGAPDGCTSDIVRERAALSYADAWEGQVRSWWRPGFELHVATVDLGCRNWAGSPVFACAAYKEKLYSFTGDPGGCDTPPRYDDSVIALLARLREG